MAKINSENAKTILAYNYYEFLKVDAMNNRGIANWMRVKDLHTLCVRTDKFTKYLSVYTDEDLNPHTHQRWVHVLVHLSATLPLKHINSTPKACGFKSSMVYNPITSRGVEVVNTQMAKRLEIVSTRGREFIAKDFVGISHTRNGRNE